MANPEAPDRKVERTLLVDSGATYSVLPLETWKALGLAGDEEITLTLADGRSVSRSLSEARFELQGKRRTSPVILGEGDDVGLLGAVTLETLGFVLDPLSRQLRPIRTLIAATRGG